MKIAIGADHGGYQLKEDLVRHLRLQGHEVMDVGTSSNKAVDYPIFAYRVAERVADGSCERGIIVDGAGIGSCMAANKVDGVRAALAYDISSARNSVEHNNANVLTLGAGLTGPALARQIVHEWLQARCSEDRHLRRVALIMDIEKGRIPTSAPSKDAVAAGSAGTADPAELSEEDLDRIMARLEQLAGVQLAAAQGPGLASGPAAAGSPWASGHHPGPAVGSDPAAARNFLGLGVGRLSTSLGPGSIPRDIARFIDHTLLRPNATAADIQRLCAEAREYGFAAVCVNPCWIPLVARELRGTGVVACSVVGFPLGATHPETKALEARRAIREGAREIDMVINIGALKGGDLDLVLRDIRAVVEACRDGNAHCKVIIETALLTDEEKRTACRLARQARAHFVKTSTGFSTGGATVHDVALMAHEVRPAGLEVKASGGIKSYQDARHMIEAGATRIGASAGIAIVQEALDVTVSA
jgi:deoxyribose-phosphate aldolase